MSLSILVVDDEADAVDLFRQSFRRELRSGDLVLHFAQSGQAALDLIESGVLPAPRLILSDINMPGMDGLTLLDRVKRRWPALPVVMLTAYGDVERRSHATRLGAAGVFAKPVDFMALKARVAHLRAAFGEDAAEPRS
jgi:CheY-like chemotaxis protein